VTAVLNMRETATSSSNGYNHIQSTKNLPGPPDHRGRHRNVLARPDYVALPSTMPLELC
jgi:hypothetical protein